MPEVRAVATLSTVAELMQIRNQLASKLCLHRGDITKLQVDAIVNAANSRLLGGGGVDGAIHSAAGPGLVAECRKLNGCTAGNAVITDAYCIRHVKKIIHTVGPQVHYSLNSSHVKLLRNCYVRSLELLVENHLRTIAFPCISTGIYGYPQRDACHTAFDSVAKWLQMNDNFEKVDRVVFCVFLLEDYHYYEELFKKVFAGQPTSTSGGDDLRCWWTPFLSVKKFTEDPEFSEHSQKGIIAEVDVGASNEQDEESLAKGEGRGSMLKDANEREEGNEQVAEQKPIEEKPSTTTPGSTVADEVGEPENPMSQDTSVSEMTQSTDVSEMSQDTKGSGTSLDDSQDTIITADSDSLETRKEEPSSSG